MECAQAREQVSAYQDKMLPQGETRLLEEHLKECKECAEYFRDMRKVLAHVRNLDEVEPPPWMARKIMAKIRAEAEPEPKKGILRRLFYPLQIKLPVQAAAALLIAVSVFYIYNTMQPDLEVARIPLSEHAPQVGIQEKGEGTEDLPDIPSEPRMSPAPSAESHGPGITSLRKGTVQRRAQERQGDKSFEESPFSVRGQERMVPSAHTAQKEAPEAQAQFRFAETKAAGKNGVRSSLLVSVTDIETGSRHAQEAILHFEGEVIATVSSRDRTIFTAEVDARKLQELIEKLEMHGEVRSEGVMQDKGEGTLVIEIEIVQKLR